MQKIIDLAVLAAVLAAVGATALASQQEPSSTTAPPPAFPPRRSRRCDRRRQPAQRQVPQRHHRPRPRALHQGRLASRRDAALCARQHRHGGHHRLPRNMNTFDAATVKTGDVARGRAVFEGQRRLREVPPRRARWLARRSQPERHRIGSQRRIAAALAPRADQPDDADQPPRASGDEGRDQSSTAGASTRTPTAFRSWTTASGCTRS